MEIERSHGFILSKISSEASFENNVSSSVSGELYCNLYNIKHHTALDSAALHSAIVKVCIPEHPHEVISKAE